MPFGVFTFALCAAKRDGGLSRRPHVHPPCGMVRRCQGAAWGWYLNSPHRECLYHVLGSVCGHTKRGGVQPLCSSAPEPGVEPLPLPEQPSSKSPALLSFQCLDDLREGGAIAAEDAFNEAAFGAVFAEGRHRDRKLQRVVNLHIEERLVKRTGRIRCRF